MFLTAFDPIFFLVKFAILLTATLAEFLFSNFILFLFVVLPLWVLHRLVPSRQEKGEAEKGDLGLLEACGFPCVLQNRAEFDERPILRQSLVVLLGLLTAFSAAAALLRGLIAGLETGDVGRAKPK